MPDEDDDPEPYVPEVEPLITVQALARWVREKYEDWEAEELVDYAMVLLEGVSAYVREETVQTWLNDEDQVEAVPQSIRTVVMQMAGRIWRNAEGVIQETTGPFTSRWAEKIAEGLYFTDAEERIVKRYRIDNKSGLFTLAVTMGALDPDAAAAEYDPYDESWPGT